MNYVILSQLELIETQLRDSYKTIKMEMENFHNQNGEEYKDLYNQLVAVKSLLHFVRDTLREAAPELYPDF